MPRSRSSGALSIESKARNSASPFRARYFVMAAVRRRLAVVDVADGADVDVGLGALELLLGHRVRWRLLRLRLRRGLGVEPTIGLEPMTSSLPRKCSAELSYVGPTRDRRAGGQERNRTSTVDRRLIYSQLSSPPAQPTHRCCVVPDPDGHGWRRSRLFSWSRRRDSNPEPAVYKTAALPIELRRRDAKGYPRVPRAQR